jgi:hypothetical protein
VKLGLLSLVNKMGHYLLSKLVRISILHDYWCQNMVGRTARLSMKGGPQLIATRETWLVSKVPRLALGIDDIGFLCMAPGVSWIFFLSNGEFCGLSKHVKLPCQIGLSREQYQRVAMLGIDRHILIHERTFCLCSVSH